MSKILEIEFDTRDNNQVFFPPLGVLVRGRFEIGRVRDPKAQEKRDKWGDAIPSQRVLLDLDTQEGQVVEALHDPNNREAKARIEGMKMKVPDTTERVKLSKDGLATWVHWMKRFVESGAARIVRGTFPDKVDGKPRLSFLQSAEQALSPDMLAMQDTLNKVLAQNAALMEQNSKLMAQFQQGQKR